MATNWFCPIDGALPADDGTTTQTPHQQGTNALPTYASDGQPVAGTQGAQVNLNGAAAVGDYWGNPPHCPICGCATIFTVAAKVTALTGVASGSQHPVDYAAAYECGVTDGNNTQYSTTSPYLLVGSGAGMKKTRAAHATVGGNVTRGAQVADNEANPFPSTNKAIPETINTVAGPQVPGPKHDSVPYGNQSWFKHRRPLRSECTPTQLEFIDWLLNPDRAGSMAGFAKEHGVSTSTVAAWKRHPTFREEWERRANALNVSIERTQDIIGALYKKALDGDVKAMSLYLQYTEKFTPKRAVVHEDRSVQDLDDEELADAMEASAHALRKPPQGRENGKEDWTSCPDHISAP